MAEGLSSIRDIDFDFENTPIRVVVTREAPELSGARTKVGQLMVGQEVELAYWIAERLEKAGIVRFRDEDSLNLGELSKIHWRETIPASRQIPSLPLNFYCLLRRFLASVKDESGSDPSKIRELEKAENLSRDIVNCRLRKIVSLAAGPAQSAEGIEGLTLEERSLYLKLSSLIGQWKAQVLTPRGTT